MKKLITPILLLTCFLYSCTEGGLTASFDVDYSAEVTIPGGTITGATVDETSDPISVDDPAFGDNSATIEKINSAKMSSAVITITAPAGEDFSFLQDMNVFLKGTGLTEALVASKTIDDPTATSITLDVEDINVAEHMKTESFTLRYSGTTTEDVANDLTLSGAVTFKVKTDL